MRLVFPKSTTEVAMMVFNLSDLQDQFTISLLNTQYKNFIESNDFLITYTITEKEIEDDAKKQFIYC